MDPTFKRNTSAAPTAGRRAIIFAFKRIIADSIASCALVELAERGLKKKKKNSR